MNLAALRLKDPQQIRLIPQTRIVAQENVGRRTFILRLFNRTLSFQVKILQEQFAVVVEIVERDQQRRLFIIVVVPLRPFRAWQRRILFVPGARVFVGRKRTHQSIGTRVAKRLVETTDPVVRRGDEH